MNETATGTHKIIDKGGRVLTNAQVQLIFWGDWNNSSLNPSKDKIVAATQNIINSNYYSKLSQYRGVQKPTYLGFVINNISPLPTTFEDSDITEAIGHSIKEGSVPDFRSFSNGEIIYIVIPTPGHESTDRDNDAFHANFKYKGNDKGVYAVLYSWEDDEGKDIEPITRALAHEIAEAWTNPGPKAAFIGPDDEEIADSCEDISDTVNGVIVEGYWSDLDGDCVIPK